MFSMRFTKVVYKGSIQIGVKLTNTEYGRWRIVMFISGTTWGTEDHEIQFYTLTEAYNFYSLIGG